MPKRSSKRRLKGVKLRRVQLAVLPEAWDDFEYLAGRNSYNVTFEAMAQYLAEKKRKKENTHSPVDSSW